MRLDERLSYQPGFVAAPEADRVLADLLSAIAWERKEVVLFGRRIPSPRRTAYYGDAGTAYRYSGLTLEPRPWLPALADLRTRLEAETDCRFNCVLANLYRTGADSMGWHSDDERELGSDPVVASLSFGAERRFALRHRGDGRTIAQSLAHGSLLLMEAGAQRAWRHHVPKTRVAVGPRINLTYRYIAEPGTETEHGGGSVAR